MKNAKLLTTLGAVTLIGAIGIGSTFAYLTDKTATVTNTFTVGNVSFDEAFAGGLAEHEVVRDEESGEYVAKIVDENVVWVNQNAYTDLVAGENLHKNPTVFIADTSQDAWVFVKVENTNQKAFAEIAWNDAWTDVTSDYKETHTEDDGTNYIVLAKSDKMKAGEASAIFTSVTLSDEITGETEFSDIVVKAFAIQASGFESYEKAVSEVVFQ